MKLYNTLTRKKEEFVPLEEGKKKYVMFVVLQFMTTFTLVMQDPLYYLLIVSKIT